MVTCSMYKVPLNMYFTEKVYNGEIDWDTEIGGVKYSDILRAASSAPATASRSCSSMRSAPTTTTAAPYAVMGEDPDTVDAKYYENNFFTAEQMIFCLHAV